MVFWIFNNASGSLPICIAQSSKLIQVAHRAVRLSAPHVFKHVLRTSVSRTEHAPAQNQRVAEDLLCLRLLAALPERDRKVGRRGQRPLVIRVEQASRGDEHLALDLRGLGALPCFQSEIAKLAGVLSVSWKRRSGKIIFPWAMATAHTTAMDASACAPGVSVEPANEGTSFQVPRKTGVDAATVAAVLVKERLHRLVFHAWCNTHMKMFSDTTTPTSLYMIDVAKHLMQHNAWLVNGANFYGKTTDLSSCPSTPPSWRASSSAGSSTKAMSRRSSGSAMSASRCRP